jgi:HNH endonuclease
VQEDCRQYDGPIYGDGYGRVNGRTIHRLVYEETFGPIPEGYLIHHRCENRACVNPEHLEAMSHADHVRLHRPHEARPLRTHCKNGHEWTPENTLRPPSRPRTRICRACRREVRRRYNASR